MTKKFAGSQRYLFRSMAFFMSIFFVLISGFMATSSASTQVLIAQPNFTRIIGNFFVPPANATQNAGYNSDHNFLMVGWEANQYPNSHGLPSPLICTATSQYTGVSSGMTTYQYQYGFKNTCGSSFAQMYHGTVGAYLNSADLPAGSSGNKMMITPQQKLMRPVYVYAASTGYLRTNLDLQVPIAVDSHTSSDMTYINGDFSFIDRTSGEIIVYSAAIFFNGHSKPSDTLANQDTATGNYMYHAPLYVGSSRVTVMADSAVLQGSSWTGWKHFDFVINETSFANALAQVRSEYPTVNMSSNPADWGFFEFHLNAEMHYILSAPTKLGWSMKAANIVWEH